MGVLWARRVVPSTVSNVKNRAMVLMQYVNLKWTLKALAQEIDSGIDDTAESEKFLPLNSI